MAWLALAPCALASVAGILLLGPLLGDAFLARGPETFWNPSETKVLPHEHGRFLIGLLGPPLLAAVVLVSARLPVRMNSGTVRPLVTAAQLALLGFIAVCFAAQHNVIFNADYRLLPHIEYFSWRTLATAAGLTLLVPAILRRPGAAARGARWVRETGPRRVGCVLAAAALTAVWLLTAINLDSSLGHTNEAVFRHLLWSMNETFAILDGRTPLADFHSQYGQLWPYAPAVTMGLLGASIGVYTTTMAAVSGLAMLGVYDVFRRVARSSALALVLYLPFLATSFFTVIGPPENRYNPANLYEVWPIRFAGPFLVAWLVARHVDRPGRHAWLPFLAAGLALLNNPEFGAAAFAATFVALACARAPPTRRTMTRLLGHAAIGLLSATAAVAVLTLVRSGRLPRFGSLFEFSKLYGLDGWAAGPMRTMGLHLAIFLTPAAALTLAAVRVVRGNRDLLLTSMLAWAGTFGLLASGYWAGRAQPWNLFDFFSVWAFSLALLLVAVARGLAARGWRRPTLPELAVLFGFGIAVCSLAQTPTPSSQIARLRDRTATPLFAQTEARELIARDAAAGERVEILIPLGFRVAYDLGLVNVSPYSSIESMPTKQQLQTAIDALREAHGHKLFVSSASTPAQALRALARAGFEVADSDGDTIELRDDASAAG